MNIVETILNSQGGQAAQNLAKQFNLSPQQVQGAVQGLVPQLVAGLKNNVAQNGVQGLISALQSGNHGQYLQNVSNALSSSGLADGQAILGKIFGGNDVANTLASKVSASTGIDTQKLQSMLPAITAMLMGALGKAQATLATASGAAAGAIAGAQAGASASSAMQSPLGQMAGGLLGKLQGAAQGVAGKGQSAAGGLMALLDANHDGSVADELMNLAGKFLKR